MFIKQDMNNIFYVARDHFSKGSRKILYFISVLIEYSGSSLSIGMCANFPNKWFYDHLN